MKCHNYSLLHAGEVCNVSVETEGSWEIPLCYYETLFILECLFSIMGIIGNVIVCIVIICGKSTHTLTNCYLFNLSISDLLILSTRPFLDIVLDNEIAYSEILNETSHFVINFIFKTSMFVSILTITAFTIERYLAICHPLYVSVISEKQRTVKLLVLFWIASLPCALAELAYMSIIHRHLSDAMYDFMNSIQMYLYHAIAITFCFVPLIIITTMYILIGVEITRKTDNFKITSKTINDADQKAAMIMMGVIIIPIFISWSTTTIMRLADFYHSNDFIRYHVLNDDNMNFITLLGYMLFSLSTAINPIIYSFISARFRKALKEVIFQRCAREQLEVSHNSSSTKMSMSMTSVSTGENSCRPKYVPS